MKYFARGMNELLKTSQLTLEFYRQLDDFQIHFIEMCFKRAIEENIGMLTELENYNYHVFQEFKSELFYEKHGIHQEWWKKVA